MQAVRALAAALALGLVAPAHAQQDEGTPTVAPAVEETGTTSPAEAATGQPESTEVVTAETAVADSELGPDYTAWEETAARAEAMSEAGRGSVFALNRLRQEIVQWRSTFGAAQAANAARIATVQSQLEALGPPPDEGLPPEDARVAARREALNAELARLRAPGLLAQEAYAHADGLIGEIDSLLRSRQAAALLSRSISPLDPRVWPEMADSVSTRVMGLMKEVSTSVRSQVRQANFARDWPLSLLFAILGGVLLLRGRRWLGRLEIRMSANRPRGRFRGQHAAAIGQLLLSLGQVLAPLLALFAWALAVRTTGLFGARALALTDAVPRAGACVLAASWLAQQFFTNDRPRPVPFDFGPAVRDTMAQRLSQAGWILAADVVLRAFLATGDIAPEARAGLLLPIEIALAVVVFRFGRCLSTARPEGVAPEDDNTLFRRRMIWTIGRVVMAVAAVAPVLSVLGFHRAGGALLLPSVMTLGLLGLLVVLQWLLSDLYALLTRREDGLRDALLPVLAGFALFLIALPLLALIWGARPEDLVEAWQRFLAGVSVGETRLSPRQFAVFGLIFAVGWFLTRVVQGMLRSTVLPRTRLDPGAQNALVSGLGYVGVVLAAILAVTFAGLDLSNLAIVAGALSVGIGFGLQNIVQNFVSGIILLIERPINEGDWIEVGGRMGYVRDISVRSTRLETFDRTDVIIPNADLVSGQVVNWTRGNLVGRIILPVSVGYGNDVDYITRLLREIAEAHPMVLLSPPPAVVLAGFGADVLNFEIRAIIRDVNFGTTTRSEINEEIARRFLKEGIHTAAPPAAPPPPPRPAAA